MRKTLIIILALIFMLALGYIFFSVSNQNNGNVSPAPTPNASPSLEANIVVSDPVAGQEINFPFTIKGEARVFESQFNLRIKDSSGTVIYESTGYANAPEMGQYGPFEIKVDYLFKKPADENITLEVFDYSAKDGSIIDLVSIPLKLNLGITNTVKAFFNNSKMDPEFSCNKVFPVNRIIPKTESIARRAVELLLLGSNREEQDAGFFTSINSGVKINKLVIHAAPNNLKGIAEIDFSEELEQGVGGSCRVSAIRAQITQTLLQFPTINGVTISINGRIEDILQP